MLIGAKLLKFTYQAISLNIILGYLWAIWMTQLKSYKQSMLT
jgi:hypothetical protein